LVEISEILNRNNPNSIAMELAKRVKKLRLASNMTQQMLAEKSGVSLGSVKRFEQLGLISLQHLLHIAVALNAAEDFIQLFSQPHYDSIDALVKLKMVETRKRVRRK